MDLNSLCNQPSGEPKPGPSCFVGRNHPVNLIACCGGASPITVDCIPKRQFVRLNSALRFGLPQTRDLRGQYPAFATEFDGQK
jgi:hypothetical protein